MPNTQPYFAFSKTLEPENIKTFTQGSPPRSVSRTCDLSCVPGGAATGQSMA